MALTGALAALPMADSPRQRRDTGAMKDFIVALGSGVGLRDRWEYLGMKLESHRMELGLEGCFIHAIFSREASVWGMTCTGGGFMFRIECGGLLSHISYWYELLSPSSSWPGLHNSRIISKACSGPRPAGIEGIYCCCHDVHRGQIFPRLEVYYAGHYLLICGFGKLSGRWHRT